jgi:large repetitive protein
VHSFTAATPILMANGTTKPISKVAAGDKVVNSVPGKKGKTEVHKVEKVIVTKTDHDFVDLTIATQDAHGRPGGVGKLTTTFHHPFYDQTQAAFVDAAKLQPGDQLQQPDGHTVVVMGVRLYTATQTTYDLTINGLHTYYVETSSGDPVLVHNCTPVDAANGPAGVQMPMFVLEDGEGATANQIAASMPGGGTRVGQSAKRQELLDLAESPYQCGRCGMQTANPDNMHLGHVNVPTSKGGNLADENVCLEGAACNLSAGNRGRVKPGRSCAERGSCGAPYGRTD